MAKTKIHKLRFKRHIFPMQYGKDRMLALPCSDKTAYVRIWVKIVLLISLIAYYVIQLTLQSAG